MFKIFNLQLVLGLALLCPQLHSKEIIRINEVTTTNNIDELAKEINSLNINLDLLSVTVSKILSRGSHKAEY